MPKLKYLKFDGLEWLGGRISRMSHRHKGVYIDLVAIIAKDGDEHGQIEYDKFTLERLRLENATILDDLIIEGFIQRNGDSLSIKWISQQILDYDVFCEKQRQRVSKRWAKRY